MPSGGGFAFGPFQLDTRAKRLLRSDEPVAVPSRHLDLLLVLLSRAGEVVSKDQLIEAAWQGVAVDDNSAEKAMSQLRRTLDPEDLTRYIETVPRRGYRFTKAVTPMAARQAEVEVEALLAPDRALLDGTAALLTLERSAIASARSKFEQVVRHHPDEAAFHVGFAMACVLQYEMTRTGQAPDVESLRLAVVHAREACRLNPNHAEACMTLGFVLERTGDRLGALAALRRGTKLEPDNWRNQLRLALGSWDEERLRAARRALALNRDSPLAHLLAATIFVARDMLAEAERELDAGLVEMPRESSKAARLVPVALHWLKGLLCLARGAVDDALAAFERELALEAGGQLYAREYCAHTWCAIGACRLQRDDRDAARAAFDQAIARVPLHPMAHAGLALLGSGQEAATLAAPMSVDVAMARAALLVADGDAPAAVQLVAAALTASSPGNAGWLIPIEPMLHVQRDRAVWTAVLTELRMRAC